MLSVIDTPEMVEHEEHTLYEDQPQVRVARSGFWRTVMQYMKRQSVHRLQNTSSSYQGPRHPIEMPADLLARQYPSLYIQAYAGV
jgi:hypothetical protein